MINQRKCRHRHTEVVKIYRKNYPHGKNSKARHYDPPRQCRLMCTDCGEELQRWKPAWTAN